MEHEQDKNATFFRFEDLRIYHKSLEYADFIFTSSKSAGNDPIVITFFERLLASAQNVSLNIAEGSSRNKSQFVYYLKMAKSSVRECVVLTTIAVNRNILSKDGYDHSKNQLMEMTKMLGALIGSLQRSVKPGEKDEDDEDDTM
jgi:four helix bundle protein